MVAAVKRVVRRRRQLLKTNKPQNRRPCHVLPRPTAPKRTTEQRGPRRVMKLFFKYAKRRYKIPDGCLNQRRENEIYAKNTLKSSMYGAAVGFARHMPEQVCCSQPTAATTTVHAHTRLGSVVGVDMLLLVCSVQVSLCSPSAPCGVARRRALVVPRGGGAYGRAFAKRGPRKRVKARFWVQAAVQCSVTRRFEVARAQTAQTCAEKARWARCRARNEPGVRARHARARSGGEGGRATGVRGVESGKDTTTQAV